MSGKRKSSKSNANTTSKKTKIKGQCDISVNSTFEDEAALKKLTHFVEEGLEHGDSCTCMIF